MHPLLKTTRRQVSDFLSRLNANVADYCADRIVYETFAARQRETWDAIEAAGRTVSREVTRLVAEQSRKAVAS